MIEDYLTYTPSIEKDVWIHTSAVIIGDVQLAPDVSIWPNAVLRGDINFIKIGTRTNIQDGAILHGTTPTPLNPKGYPTIVGDDVTIGHNAVLHGCTIGNRVLVGMSATILDGTIIPDNVVIGACSFIPMNKKLESGYLYLGSPAKKIRPLSEEERLFLEQSATHYVDLKNNYT